MILIHVGFTQVLGQDSFTTRATPSEGMALELQRARLWGPGIESSTGAVDAMSHVSLAGMQMETLFSLEVIEKPAIY